MTQLDGKRHLSTIGAIYQGGDDWINGPTLAKNGWRSAAQLSEV